MSQWYAVLQHIHFSSEDKNGLKVEGLKKILCANNSQERAKVSILSVFLKGFKILREKALYFMLIKIEKYRCTPVFIAALFTKARIWKQSRCLSVDEWIRKLWYIYKMEYY